MFRVVMVPQVKWPVVVEIPVDGGRTEPQPPFEVTFKLLTDDEIDKLEVEDDRALLRQVVLGWDETKVGDADNKPFPFTPANLETLIAIPYVRKALFKAWQKARLGAREKN